MDDNRPSLTEAIASAFEPARSPDGRRLQAAELDRARTLDAQGDRVEARALEATTMPAGYPDPPGVTQVCRAARGLRKLSRPSRSSAG